GLRTPQAPFVADRPKADPLSCPTTSDAIDRLVVDAVFGPVLLSALRRAIGLNLPEKRSSGADPNWIRFAISRRLGRSALVGRRSCARSRGLVESCAHSADATGRGSRL